MTNSKKSKKNILEILEDRAKNTPDKEAFKFLVFYREQRKEYRLNFGELYERVNTIADFLSKRNLQGERAILLYPDGLEFITSFLGCIAAGVVAVPLYHFRTKRKADRLKSIIADSNPAIFLSDSRNIKKLMEYSDDIDNSCENWVATDVIKNFAKPIDFSKYKGSDLAYLQYTSGSTSTPKGVMITHQNIIHNMEIINSHFGTNEDSLGVSWIPHYHDMGLIYTILHPIYVGYTQILMQPADYISKPYRFYQIISEFRANMFVMPNFAFDYSVNMITDTEKKNLDLSCVEIAGNGSEPIHIESMNCFYEFFKSTGFKKSAFLPGYGLAEATLVVTTCDFDESNTRLKVINIDLEMFKMNKICTLDYNRDGIVCCSSGVIRDDVTVKIVNPETLEECKENFVGEIWTASPSVSAGYWQKTELNSKIFCGHIHGSDTVSYLRTGDLGFINNKNLYVCGRLKDVLIIRGVNFYPNDIEYTVVSSVEEVNDNGCIAFTVRSDADDEQLFIALEVLKTIEEVRAKEITRTIKKQISEVYGLQVTGILLLSRGKIPKTSSGKVQRSLCKEYYVSKKLETIFADVQ